ncbi:MAG: DNA-directed RNA polymerase subunit L [Promethearchaeota archaeon]|nr:MAG: DNA-directed RNA polymerase subunit L [Candidatus Lokiarchaeota archaeon]
MAKKKDDDLIDEYNDAMDEDIQSVYPEIEETKEPKKVEEEEEFEELIEEEDDLEDHLDFVMEDEAEGPQYKYLDIEIHQPESINNFEVVIKNQSHGFLNIFVNHLLALEGVILAAYKKTNIEEPRIFIKLKDGYKIKEILREGIDSLRTEVLEVQKLFNKLM